MVNIKVVIGANYGDEGKGRMVDYFVRQAYENNPNSNVIVVCSNGGAQRGHTVVLENGYNHIFHHFGSGTLAGADTYLPENFIVNPMIFMKEYNEIDYFAPTVFVHPNCLVSTPFDMMNNQIIEESRGSNKHGSCGVGIWETIVRKGARYNEICKMTDEEMFNYLKSVRDMYSKKRFLRHNISMSDEWFNIYYDDNIIHNYIRDFRAMQKLVTIAELDIITHYDDIIFENGQGLLLDGASNTDDLFSTPSNTTASAALCIITDAFEDYFKKYKHSINSIELCYVTRSYLTRHSIGEFRQYRDLSEMSFIIPNYETNRNNPHQGEFRYGMIDSTYFFDLYTRASHDYNNFISSRFYIDKDDIKMSIAVTHMDENELSFTDIEKYISYHPDIVYKVYGPRCNDKIIIDRSESRKYSEKRLESIKDSRTLDIIDKLMKETGIYVNY